MKITYFALLALIKEGKAPDLVKYAGKTYKFNGHEYETVEALDGWCLGRTIAFQWTSRAQTTAEIIEVVEDADHRLSDSCRH